MLVDRNLNNLYKLLNEMKKYYIVLALMLISVVTFAQGQGEENPFEFADRSYEMEETEVPSYFTKHWLGAEFTKLTFALRQEYVYMPEATSISPQPVLITEKEIIYTSVKKMDRYYKKEVKKSRMTEAQAKEKLKKVFAVVYSLRYAETEEIEKIFWNTKKAVELEKLLLKTIELY